MDIQYDVVMKRNWPTRLLGYTLRYVSRYMHRRPSAFTIVFFGAQNACMHKHHRMSIAFFVVKDHLFDPPPNMAEKTFFVLMVGRPNQRVRNINMPTRK